MLPGNKYRMVLEVSSVNFELKSEAEQDAIIETYQNFLNSLAIPLQILVRIREMDMQRYLDHFRSQSEHEAEAIYRTQIDNYVQFVQGLVTANKILSRQFYVVVPYTGTGKNDFEVVREQLLLNSDIISKGLGRLGVRTKHLNNVEILDLFYSFYNPTAAKRQPLTNQTFQLLSDNYL